MGDSNQPVCRCRTLFQMTFMWLGVKTLQVLRCWTQHHNEIAPSHLCVCEVIVLDNPACLFYKTPHMFCMALKSSTQCSSPLIADFSFAAVSAQKGSWQQHGCSMCNVSCGRLFLEVKAHVSQKKLSPLRLTPLQKLKVWVLSLRAALKQKAN